MKKQYLLAILLTVSFIVLKAQNTIPTTTCTGAMKINDSLNVNKDITANGDITSKGEVTSTDTLRAMQDVVASKDVKVDGSVYVGDKLNVSGQSTFEQEMIVKKSILFDSGNEFSFVPATATTKATFYLGKSVSKTTGWNQCPNPNAISSGLNQFVFPGALALRTPPGAVGSTDASLTLFSAPWDGNAFIEVEGNDNSGTTNNGLYLNHFCGRNTHINTNWNIANGTGGTVFLGAKVDMQQSMRIGAAGSPINFNTSIEIDQAVNNANAIKVNTTNPSVKVLSVLRNDNKNTFIVYGDGKTQIGVATPIARATSSLTVDGEIACKSLYVLKPQSWADFVFKKKDLETLENVEKYINKNNHLPGIPSEKEIMENGYDINEMDAKLLEKIETLYLHIIALEKEIKELKK